MIQSLEEVYRYVAWLTKFTDASRGYQQIMVKKNPQYARYTKTEIRAHVLSCAHTRDEVSGYYSFDDEDLWTNYFMKEPMLAERLAELGIDSIQHLTSVVFDVQLDRRMARKTDFLPFKPAPADDEPA